MAKNLDFGVEQDMTPMIDIVFLLIIFFMVVTELTMNQAEIVLPVAPEAKVVEPQPGSRVLTINVSIDNDTKSETHGQSRMQINNGEYLTEKALATALRGEATAYGVFDPKPNNVGEPDSAVEVIIRCDRNAHSEYFHKIFAACQKAKIYKVSLAAQYERLGNPYDLDE